jgi:predicted histidine transporter YuiF (NhaC family)
MMPFVSSLFVGIAYDSGGVASGPMIGTFIFAFIQGVAQAKGVNLITNGFGMIAMVAFTPLVALQILGLIYKFKSRKGGLEHANE